MDLNIPNLDCKSFWISLYPELLVFFFFEKSGKCNDSQTNFLDFFMTVSDRSRKEKDAKTHSIREN